MDIVCIRVIFVGQLCSIQLADSEIFKVSEITHFPKLPAFTLGLNWRTEQLSYTKVYTTKDQQWELPL